MALSKEQILTLTCLKEVGVMGLGPKKILTIGSIVIEKDMSILSYKELADLMQSMKEKAIHKVTLSNLIEANQIANKIIEASYLAEIGFVGYYDEDFPEKRRKTINEEGKSEPPLLLWYRGDLSITNMPGLAVIGTREATQEGMEGGEYISGEFAKRGFNIVSGLAIGCDTSGHVGALKVGGKTTAILANGLDDKSIYPAENLDLAKNILKYGGLLLSEYRIGTTVNKYSLVSRDRLQSGLSVATLVIQTGETGGTMHAANATFQSGKPLYTMLFKDEKVNQNEKCRGNALLVKKGAKYIKGNDDIDEIIDSIHNRKIIKTDLFD